MDGDFLFSLKLSGTLSKSGVDVLPMWPLTLLPFRTALSLAWLATCAPAETQRASGPLQALASAILALSFSPPRFLTPSLSSPFSPTPFPDTNRAVHGHHWKLAKISTYRCWAHQSQRNIRQFMAASQCPAWRLCRSPSIWLSDWNSQLDWPLSSWLIWGMWIQWIKPQSPHL